MRQKTEHQITLSRKELEILALQIDANKQWLTDLSDVVTINLDYDTDYKTLRLADGQYQCKQHSNWSDCAAHNFSLNKEVE